jgi:hypothetical protein
MMSENRTKEEYKYLSAFLPTNLLSEIDDNINLSTQNTHKGSHVSNYFY